jgi:hypothetical protein
MFKRCYKDVTIVIVMESDGDSDGGDHMIGGGDGVLLRW